MRRCALLAAALLGGIFTGCGYHVAGRASQLPTDLHTLAIPAFENQTSAYRIEQVLNAAVVREFITRTRYHVVHQADSSADATLRGTITNVYLIPATVDSITGRSNSVVAYVLAHISLTDRHGKVLFDNPSYGFRQQYQVSVDPASFFEEESPALARLSEDFARTVVSNILEAF